MIGPPGTGKSQTIANLIATLAARGKSVLFVAEKRAAIEVVIKRLHQQGLGDLLLDLHDGGSNRRRLAGELERALASNREALTRIHASCIEGSTVPAPNWRTTRIKLHAPVKPWGVSAFDAQQRLLEIGDSAAITVRLRGSALDRLTQAVAEQAMEDVQRFVELDGPAVLRDGGRHPWTDAYAAKRITDEVAVTNVMETFGEIRHEALPELHETVRELRSDTDLKESATLDDVRTFIDLGEKLGNLLDDCRPGVLALGLDEVVSALGPASGALSRTFAALFSGRYRRARAAMREQALAAGAPRSGFVGTCEPGTRVATMWSVQARMDASPSEH